MDDLLVELADEKAVRALAPDIRTLMSAVPHGVIVTAQAEDHSLGYDYVSRCFFPGIGEDPVTGSAHTALAPFWSERLGRARLNLFIGGEWVTPATDERIRVVSPNTGLPIGSVPHAGQADVAAAVRAARAASDDRTGWARWTPMERSHTLVRMAEEFERRRSPQAARSS